MAHSRSARKRVRQTVRRNAANRMRVSRIRTYLKKVETAIATGDKTQAQEAFKAAMPELHKGVGKGLVKKNTAARRLSRLNARIKAL